MIESEGKTPGGFRKGCGIFAAVVLVGLGLLSFSALRPVREAKQVEESINLRFGETTAYTPPADGSVEPDRLEAFLHVRKALIEPCANYRENRARLERFDQRKEAGVLSTGDHWHALKGALRLGPRFLDFVRARNAALLEVEMGLGEYSYIFAVAYAEQLAEMAENNDRTTVIKPRVRRELTQILRNQLAALEASEPDMQGGELAAELRGELVALENGSHILPWQSGLPDTTKASLAPFAERLNDLYCAEALKFELAQKNKSFGGFRD
jgi:hypothetical protein